MTAAPAEQPPEDRRGPATSEPADDATGTGPGDLSVPALLAERAKADPDRVVLLLDGTQPLTVADWDRRSTRLARALAGRRIRPGDRVGLLFGDRDWISYAIGYCAVLRAGAVAVPLPARLPAGSVRDRLDRASASLLVHAGDSAPALDLMTVSFASLDKPTEPSGPTPAAVRVPADGLAEIRYAGRDGEPARAMVTSHADLVVGPWTSRNEAPFGAPGHVLCDCPVGSADGQSMLMHALAGRATVLLLSHATPDQVGRLIEIHRVGAVLLAPPLVAEMAAAGTQLHHDLSSVGWAGSGLVPMLPARQAALHTVFPGATLVAHYGSAGSVPATTRMLVDPGRPGSVGRPMDGAALVVAGPDRAPLPAGRVGEVWLRSPAPGQEAVGKPPPAGESGSVGQSRLARARRAPRVGVGPGWTRMGELGYLDPDGYLYLVGRPGDVIRSGGLTVSATHVEAGLREHPAVEDAVVVGVGHPVVGAQVAAAVVLREDVTPAALRDFLRARRTEYELPSLILVVDALPRDEAGKVRRAEVRHLCVAAGGKVPPTTPTEVALAEQWSAVLGLPVSGVDDDFFALGGDSPTAAQLSVRVVRAFGVRASASFVFDNPVFAHQVAWLAGRLATRGSAGSAPRVSQVTRPLRRGRSDSGEREVVRVPLSPFQERNLMWMFGGAKPQRTLPVVASMRIAERLDLRTMRRSLNELAYRQEALRTVFTPADGRYEAITLPDCLPSFVSIRARGATLEQREQHARKLAREYVERPFDIVRGPLFRALAVHLDDDDHVLVLAVDHLVSDGLSIEVLLNELGTIYTAFRAGERSPLPPVALSCSDFFAWVRQQYGHNRRYWQRALAGAPAAVGPLPGQNTSVRRYANRSHDFTLPADLCVRLRGAYTEHGVTPVTAGLAAWSAVLSAWTGSPEIVLFSPTSGRTRPEFASLVGSILQSPFFRLRTGDDPTFADLFVRARRDAVAATEHQFYPHYEFLSQVPFPARINVDDLARPPRLPGLDCQPFAFPATLVPDRALEDGETDLHVPRMRLAWLPDGSMRGTLTYNGQAFDATVVDQLAQDFLRFTGLALTDPSRHLSEVE